MSKFRKSFKPAIPSPSGGVVAFKVTTITGSDGLVTNVQTLGDDDQLYPDKEVSADTYSVDNQLKAGVRVAEKPINFKVGSEPSAEQIEAFVTNLETPKES